MTGEAVSAPGAAPSHELTVTLPGAPQCGPVQEQRPDKPFPILWLQKGQECANSIKYWHCCLERQRPAPVQNRAPPPKLLFPGALTTASTFGWYKASWCCKRVKRWEDIDLPDTEGGLWCSGACHHIGHLWAREELRIPEL